MKTQLLKDFIQDSYVGAELNFGADSKSRQCARLTIQLCSEEHINFSSFLKFHEDFLEGQNCEPAHIKKQIKLVGNLENYFEKQ